MSFAVVLEGMTLAAFAVLLVGGKQKREQGWGVLTILVALAAFVQAIGMALMVGDDTAFPRSRHWLTKTGILVRK
jgi:formate hydrogenlyase subunit 3/multisubunit Na+/H+ antiporter MnhD subunit